MKAGCINGRNCCRCQAGRAGPFYSYASGWIPDADGADGRSSFRRGTSTGRHSQSDPDVVVMDAPTSSLDVLHEKELLKTLQEAYSDKTLLIISHRMSTLVGCNRLIRLECGRSGGDEICKRNKRRVGWIKERERFYRSLS